MAATSSCSCLSIGIGITSLLQCLGFESKNPTPLESPNMDGPITIVLPESPSNDGPIQIINVVASTTASSEDSPNNGDDLKMDSTSPGLLIIDGSSNDAWSGPGGGDGLIIIDAAQGNSPGDDKPPVIGGFGDPSHTETINPSDWGKARRGSSGGHH